jgi:hypothetical protein
MWSPLKCLCYITIFIYGLFNDPVSNSLDYIMRNEWMTVNNELERMWKEITNECC